MRKLDYGTVHDDREGGGETTGAETDETTQSASRSGGTDDESTALTKDVVFDVLKNRRRRHVLEFLRNHEVASLSDVAEHVASVENGKEVRDLTSRERKRVYVGLYQCHLPKLADAGVVDYDANRKSIALRQRSSVLYPYLDLDHRDGSDGGGLWNWRSFLRSILDRR